MKRVFSAGDHLLVHHFKNILQTTGIACEVRNEFLMGGAGDLPVFDCWPELWVADIDAARAREIIEAESRDAAPAAADWTCRHCGTVCEPQFDACWQCGRSRDVT
ncbi:MAG: DUF2007 domain-containing protein [Gammaproteobacteria bacterium]|nr:DUF2007 domain-containing protein [Gammaproteobacteria bacterium]